MRGVAAANDRAGLDPRSPGPGSMLGARWQVRGLGTTDTAVPVNEALNNSSTKRNRQHYLSTYYVLSASLSSSKRHNNPLRSHYDHPHDTGPSYLRVFAHSVPSAWNTPPPPPWLSAGRADPSDLSSNGSGSTAVLSRRLCTSLTSAGHSLRACLWFSNSCCPVAAEPHGPAVFRPVPPGPATGSVLNGSLNG